MKKLTENIKWIVLLAIVIIASNAATYFTTSGLSKKEQKELQRRYDSLDVAFKTQEEIHQTEQTIRREIFSKDSLELTRYKVRIKNDSILLIKQNKALRKYDKLTSKQALSKLDSAYEAEMRGHN